MANIDLTVSGPLAMLSVNVPPQNRFTVETVAQFDATLDRIEASDVRAVLVRAEGPDFCCGAQTDSWISLSDRQRYEYFSKVMRVFNRFELLPIPTVAAVQGLAASLGVELAVRADIVVAGRSARFEHAEASVGIVTMIGGVHRVAERAGRSKAIEWAYSAEQTSAAEMERFGIVNKVVDDADLDRVARECAERLSRGATLAFAAHKRLLRIWSASGVDAADQATLGIALPVFLSQDAHIGVQGAADARKAGKAKPHWTFEGR
ncbi:enoyl-CoA hydratase/isomerase family protein [Rhizosaccharibacter radicis]|uniref:Enoyl-CoA hydratase/isomerase family protein n=1 Tax=Rhizosaccharibacter radicis TaxID=2782605 RepID=A0ABT1W0Q1_9PROT|nr:enoyl-CoA hydratase/isomerase family protein [Acetobacteraceae bacterium KSS12]